VQVGDGTRAAEAGMVPGDVILEVCGVKVAGEYDIYRIIFNHSVGEQLRFTVLRDKNKPLEFELLLQEFPGQS
jgi:S1-C subfamily serine protease